jgi:hypothetical protein
MELIYEIAEYLNVPNEFIMIDMVVGANVWFSTTTGAQYSCATVRGGKHLKKNSIRHD